MAEPWRIKNRERYNELHRIWVANHPPERTDERRSQERMWRAGRKRKSNFMSSVKWKQQNQEKAKAHAAVARAIRSGKLVRPDHCERCGLICKPQAHHKDYKLKLLVRWLCALCHKTEHRLSVSYAGKCEVEAT